MALKCNLQLQQQESRRFWNYLFGVYEKTSVHTV